MSVTGALLPHAVSKIGPVKGSEGGESAQVKGSDCIQLGGLGGGLSAAVVLQVSAHSVPDD